MRTSTVICTEIDELYKQIETIREQIDVLIQENIATHTSCDECGTTEGPIYPAGDYLVLEKDNDKWVCSKCLSIITSQAYLKEYQDARN
jgi:ribosomal protein L37AE/L43A